MPYLNGSLRQVIYEHVKHANKQGELCHRSIVVDLYHILGSSVYEEVKLCIQYMHTLGLYNIFLTSLTKFIGCAVPTITIVLFDDWRNGIPVAFFIAS